MKVIFIGIAFFFVIGLISTLVESISNNFDKRKQLKKRLFSLYKQLKSNNEKNVAQLEKEYYSLKGNKKKFSIKNKKKLAECSHLLSQIIEQSTTKFASDLVVLRGLVENQKVDQAFTLIQQLKLKRKTASNYCQQYDKTLKKMEDDVLALKEVQTSFDNDISRIQHFLELDYLLQARTILSDANQLIDSNPTYRNFDILLLSQLQKEIEIKEQSRLQKRNNLFKV
ncbi:MAG: hypothetical protein IKK04_02410 [Bacteroidales bacterium]|nr:hypothetical protein [Bacteroidales bacterium]